MNTLLKIAQLRNTPGVIITDHLGTPLFMNELVSSIVPVFSDNADSEAFHLPENIRKMCNLSDKGNKTFPSDANQLIYCPAGRPYALRAIPLVPTKDETGPRQVMLLVEPIAERRHINFDTVKKEFGLSKREVDVLKEMGQGLSNKEIAKRLFISEHTVKDHVKKILRAFDATSRSEVIARLLSS